MLSKSWRLVLVIGVAFVAGMCFRGWVPTKSFAGEKPKKSETPTTVKPSEQAGVTEEPETTQPGKTPRFEGLQFFSYSSGLTGVFDKTNGKLYLYDANLTNCVAIRQLNRPGEAMKTIR